MQDLCADGHSGLVKGADGGPIGCAEGEVGLAEAVAGLMPTDPELRLGWDSIPDGILAVGYDPRAAEWDEHGVVEGRAPLEVGALDGDVGDHGGKSASAPAASSRRNLR